MKKYLFATFTIYVSLSAFAGTNSNTENQHETSSMWGSVKLLYWLPTESLFDNGVVNPGFQSTGLLGTTQYVTIDYDYAPGFQLSLGVNTNYDNWDMFATWTRLHHTTNSPYTAAVPFTIDIPAIPGGGNRPFATSVNANWNIQYDTVDLVLRKNVLLSNRVTASPFVSVRGAFIKRTINDLFTGISPNYDNFFDNNADLLNGPIQTNFVSRVWGVGPRLGSDIQWLFGETGFALVATGAGALIVGNFQSTTYYSAVNYPSLNSVFDSGYNISTEANAEASLGFEYTHSWSNNCKLSVALNYDASYWFNVVNLLSYGSRERSDLAFYGPSLRFSFYGN